ncbi:MAG: non-heme iron oxygenase ferredoxin subunit [bacterium]
MSFSPVLNVSDLPIGKKRHVKIDGSNVCVYHLPDGFIAVENRCSHAGSPLCEGKLLDDGVIQCPLHGAKFSVQTGQVLGLPATSPIRTYPVKVEDDRVFVDTHEEHPQQQS